MPAPRRGDDDPLLPRAPAGMKAGTALAVLVHLLLIVALAVGLNWKVSEPKGVDAELWAAVPQVAAPRAAAAEAAAETRPPPAPQPTEPKPVVKPEPKPEPKPVARPPPEPAPKPVPKPKPEPAPPRRQEADAQIAVEKAKRAEALQRQKEDDEREEKAERLMKEKAEATRRAEAEKKAAREAAAREAAQLAEKRRQSELDERKKADAEAARQEAQRNERLKRIVRDAGGGAGADASTGSAASSAGPSAGYAGRVKVRVKPNIVYAETPAGNPTAEVEVRLAPDGRIVSQRLLRSSGLKDWDDAVLRAVERTEILPRDVDGRVPTPIVISFRPRD